MPREVRGAIARIRRKTEGNGVGVSFLARRLRVSRQYAWQILHAQTFLSLERAQEIEAMVDSIIARRLHIRSFGDRLRAARKSAGLTLKQTAAMIGYTWVAVQRWEKDVCLPKPGVLWHLAAIYGLPEGWPMNEFAPPGGGFAGIPRWPGKRKKHSGLLSIGRGAPAAALHPAARKDTPVPYGERKRT